MLVFLGILVFFWASSDRGDLATPIRVQSLFGRIIGRMAPVYITEAELARDLSAVLEKVRQGAEVIIERDAEPVAVIKPLQFRGRPIDECIELLGTNGSHAILDAEFARDLEDIINSHRDPLRAPEWD